MSLKFSLRKRGSEKPAAAEVTDESGNEAAEGGGRKRTSRLLIVLIAMLAFAFAIYSVISIAGIRRQLNERRQELSEIRDEITIQEIKNDEMSKTYNLSDKERSDYIEQLARENLDYVKEGERIFVNIAGE